MILESRILTRERYLRFVLLITPLSYSPRGFDIFVGFPLCTRSSTMLSDVLARLLASATDGPSELVGLARV